MAKRRPAGDGMVRKRDDGRWEGRIVIGHRENGEPLFRHVYAKTQKALLDKLHQNIECYRDVELTEDSRMTLGEWLDRWLNEYKADTVRPGTLRSYRTIIEQYLKPQLGEKQISLITPQDIQRMYHRLKKEGRVNEHPEKGTQLADNTVRTSTACSIWPCRMPCRHTSSPAIQRRALPSPGRAAAKSRC